MSSAPERKPPRPSVFRLAFRRQFAVGIAVWLVILAIHFPDSDPRIALFFLVPSAFAWSMRAYRIAASIVAVDLTVGAISFLFQAPHFVSGTDRASWLVMGLLQWTTLTPPRFTRSNNASDLWAYAGRLRLFDSADGPLRSLTRTATPSLLLGSLLTLSGLLLLVMPHRVSDAFPSRNVDCGSVLAPKQSVPLDVECNRGARASTDLTLVATGLGLVCVAVFVIGRPAQRTASTVAESHTDA